MESIHTKTHHHLRCRSDHLLCRLRRHGNHQPKDANLQFITRIFFVADLKRDISSPFNFFMFSSFFMVHFNLISFQDRSVSRHLTFLRFLQSLISLGNQPRIGTHKQILSLSLKVSSNLERARRV